MVCQNVAPNRSEKRLQQEFGFILQPVFSYQLSSYIELSCKRIICENCIHNARHQKPKGIVLLGEICTTETIHLAQDGRIVFCYP